MPKSRSRAKFSWKQEYGGMPAWAIAGALALIGVLFAVPAVVSATAQPATPYVRPSDAFAEPTPDAQRLRAVFVGDSNTEVNSPNFAEGEIGDHSWVYQVVTSGDFVFAGGWADGGTSSTTQAENLPTQDNADVLVVMTGTNDYGQQIPWEQTAANIQTIAGKAAAERVVVLAIAPQDNDTEGRVATFNANLAALAQANGWEFYDPMEFLRAPEAGFIEGTTSDGTHLTAESQATVGQNVLTYLRG